MSGLILLASIISALEDDGQEEVIGYKDTMDTVLTGLDTSASSIDIGLYNNCAAYHDRVATIQTQNPLKKRSFRDSTLSNTGESSDEVCSSTEVTYSPIQPVSASDIIMDTRTDSSVDEAMLDPSIVIESTQKKRRTKSTSTPKIKTTPSTSRPKTIQISFKNKKSVLAGLIVEYREKVLNSKAHADRHAQYEYSE
jgi:hypothetical protein